MTTLANFPFRNQLAAPAPSDGQADENRTFNCGEMNVSAIIQFFTGLVIAPDDIKDALFGQGSAFVPSQMDAYRSFFAARKLPIAISDLPMNVATVRSELDKGHPVVLLIPSAWGLEPPNPATEHSFHFVVAYSYDADSLSCMNPWGGFQHIGTFTYWQERLRGGAVWAFSRTAGTTVAIDTTGLGSGFAAFATAHGLSCVSAGEHEYARDAAGHGQTFAAFAPTAEFPTGVILYYNAANGELTASKAPWVATALWQRGESIRVQAADDAAKASFALTAAQAQAQKARDDLAAAQGQVSRLAAQVTQLQSQVTDLKDQLAKAQNQPPAPPAAPDAQTLDDAAVGRAFRLALARSGFHADLHGSETTAEGGAPIAHITDPAA